MDKFGRKSCLVYASTLGVIGAVGCCAAQNMALFIAFRLLAGGGAWAALSLCECFTQNTSCSIYLSLQRPSIFQSLLRPSFADFLSGLLESF